MVMMCQKNFDDYNDFPMIVYVEISQYCCKNTFTSSEIQTLYKRFQQLDKRQKGYISEDELLNIPELAINPLAPRIVQLFVNVNFKEFCRLLSFLSNKSMDEEKVKFMFKVYDVDADGIVSRNDLEIILRQLVGSTLSEDKIDGLVQKAMNEIIEIERGGVIVGDDDDDDDFKNRIDEGEEEEINRMREVRFTRVKNNKNNNSNNIKRGELGGGIGDDDDGIKLPGLSEAAFCKVFAGNVPTVSIEESDDD